MLILIDKKIPKQAKQMLADYGELLELETEEAQEVLKRASKSLFPNVRSAYRNALKVHK